MILKFLNRFSRNWIYLLIFLFFSTSCEKAVDAFVGFYNQPNFLDGKGYESTLNVMGVIRPETNLNPSGSFVRIERTGSSASDTTPVSSFVIPDAEVFISVASDDQHFVSLSFAENEQNLYGGRYYSDNFRPVAGETYNLTCVHPLYDTVYGTTTLPNPPSIINMTYGNGTGISLNVLPDETASMYQAVFLTSDTVIYTDYFVPFSQHDTITLSIEYNKELIESSLYIYAYDENLSDYFSVVTSSILNLNSFRPPVSIVEGGYGVFGSLNYAYFEDLELMD